MAFRDKNKGRDVVVMLEVKSELYVSDEVSASKLFDIDIKESDDGDKDLSCSTQRFCEDGGQQEPRVHPLPPPLPLHLL